MQFRFTLNNAIKGSHEISEPDGWKEIKIKLERDQEYHSLVEVIDVPVIFYGDNGVEDGGFDYVKDVETTQGVDALVELLIDASDDGWLTYDEFFNGLLLFESIKEISDAEAYKLECNVVRSDLWSKFKNRLETPVNLEAEEDLDGGVRTKIEPTRLPLPSQKMKEITDRQESHGTAIHEDDILINNYLQFSFNEQIKDEVKDTFILPTDVNTELPVPVVELLYSGSYTFDIRVELSIKIESGFPAGDCSSRVFVTDPTSAYIDLYFQKNNETPISFNTTDFIGQSTVYEYNSQHELVAGDQIRIYGIVSSVAWKSTNFVDHILVWGNDNSDVFIIRGNFAPTGGGGACEISSTFSSTMNFGTAPSGELIPTSLNIQADTVYPETETESYLIKDAAESILSKIVGRDNVLSSDFLGDTTPVSCGKDFAIMRGLHVRGYDFLEKPFFLSFQEWWAGANPILNLGLGYETIAGTEFIRIEDKAHFYDSDISVYFDNVDKLERIYDKDYIFKSIEIGYERWSAESASGIDDPQTKRKYNTRFKIIGRDLKILSKWVAASLAIEQTRRNRVELGKDWRMDEDIMVIAVNDDSSPIQPEFDEDFTDIVNLLNSDARYNIRLSVARNFERWKAFFNGCLQTYVDNSPCEYFKFASGEGNYDMVTTGDTCDPGRLGESQDICVTNDFYHSPQYYRFTYPMTWDDYKTIRNNRNKAIAVSATDTDHKTCFIKSLEFDHFNGTAEIEAWIKE